MILVVSCDDRIFLSVTWNVIWNVNETLYTVFVDQKPEGSSTLEGDTDERQERNFLKSVIQGPREQRNFSPRDTFRNNAR